jgi:uncharacterized coiled-coil protein SlyX
MSDKRFEQLEEKLAYMEMANAELGEEIFRTMLERIEVLQDTAAEGGAEGGAGQGERPPHY